MTIVKGLKLTGHDIGTLRPGAEVMDEVIRAFIKLRISTDSTLDIESYQMIFGVFNEDNHWELTVWFPRDGTILYLNPTGELDYRTKTNCRILQDIFKAQSP
ncbi:hypothetical protein LSH36_539g00067 [Paralvinella palmiformis]|uniref:Uncharacterized protein n=1 Tax=Paralvinella palmiformis TaxID=53620 RepID=A0AAD9J6U5_9ANNE|nr:hypothetical protein LSH36_539g00067 [Paralvinella palmiformis]